MKDFPESYLTYRIDDQLQRRKVIKATMDFGQARTLAEFQEEWQFFTPALLYIHGRFEDEPIARFNDELGRELEIGHYKFDRPIFLGMDVLGDKEWNNVLWCVRKSDWEAFENYLLSLVLVDYSTKTTYGVGSQDIQIFDPLFCETSVVLPAQLPELTVVVLGVNGNRSCIAIKEAKDKLAQRPQVKRFQPQRLAVNYAQALFRMQNPMAAISQEPDQ